MKKFLFGILISILVFGGLFLNNQKVVFSEAITKEELEINQANFLSEFYNNEKLLGESGKNYIVKIKDDINLEEVFKGKPITFTPMGTEKNPFTAEIDGCGNSLTKFNVSIYENDAAFFAYFSGTIKNIKLTNIDICSNENSALLALNANNAVFENIIIDNCSVYGTNIAGLIYNAVNVIICNVIIKVNYVSYLNSYAIVYSFNNTTAENVFYDSLSETVVSDNLERIIDADFDVVDFIANFKNIVTAKEEEPPMSPVISEDDENDEADEVDEADEEVINNENYFYNSGNNNLIFKLISLLNRMPFLRVVIFIAPLLLHNMFV